MNLMTSDENPTYAEAILETYGEIVPPRGKGKRGSQSAPTKKVPKGLNYATVHKTREKNRVVKVDQRVIYGTVTAVIAALAMSAVNSDEVPAISTNSDLYVVPVAGGPSKKITMNPAADNSPQYSPAALSCCRRIGS